MIGINASKTSPGSHKAISVTSRCVDRAPWDHPEQLIWAAIRLHLGCHSPEVTATLIAPYRKADSDHEK